MRVLYFNNCWFTNVGEAFVDIGGMHLTRLIFPEARIACMSAMTNFYVDLAAEKENKKSLFNRKSAKNIPLADMAVRLEADYVIMPGMFATEEYLLGAERTMIDELRKNGTKVIFLGMGGVNYNEKEVDAFKKYLEEIQPAFIMTRDKETYDNYKNVAPCVSGIDCAFWTVDEFDPRGFAGSEYDIVAFNRSAEPAEFSKWNRDVIRPWHFQSSYKSRLYNKDILLSDTPYDYLTVYANASHVYTDLVHATIISLMYGVSVKYWYFDKRSLAFDALDNLTKTPDEFFSVDASSLKTQKERLAEEIKARFI